MKTDIIFNLPLIEVLLAVVYLVGAFVLYEFIRTKNGALRKIMIAYFADEVFTYVCAALFYLLQSMDKSPIHIHVYLVIILVPKAIIKVILYTWLRNRKKPTIIN